MQSTPYTSSEPAPSVPSYQANYQYEPTQEAQIYYQHELYQADPLYHDNSLYEDNPQQLYQPAHGAQYRHPNQQIVYYSSYAPYNDNHQHTIDQQAPNPHDPGSHHLYTNPNIHTTDPNIHTVHQNHRHTSPQYADIEQNLERNSLGHQEHQTPSSQRHPTQSTAILANIKGRSDPGSHSTLHPNPAIPASSTYSTGAAHTMGTSASRMQDTPDVVVASISGGMGFQTCPIKGSLPNNSPPDNAVPRDTPSPSDDAVSRVTPPPSDNAVPLVTNTNRAHSPTPAISLSHPTPIIPTPGVKTQLTPDDVMAEFEKKTLSQLRDLQSTHIRYKKLNLAIKIEAQDLYFDYQRKQHLLSLKHSRPFKLLTKYLGQRRTRQKESNWHKFQQNDPDAQVALHNTDHNIGQRNKEVGKLYKHRKESQVDSDRASSQATVDPDVDPNAEERGRFGKIFKSDETLRIEVKTWANGVQLKLKELSDSFGVEGFLVLAAQDHRKPLFFQGGSLLGDDYLRGLLDEGNPMRKFAMWTAGSKKVTSKKRMQSDLELQGSDEAPSKGIGQPPKKKTKYAVAAFENRDVCKGSLALNHTYIAEELRAMFIRHLIDVPIKKMSIDDTWLVLRGLKNKWIDLVEHQFDSLPKPTHARKQQKQKETGASATIAREEEKEEEEGEEEEEEEEDDEDEEEEEGEDDEDEEDEDDDEDDY
ncbi:hypothetical protein PGTUg99_019490 [Puccinia graminis f. sp. tritici]|uniref:Uncharacterized protein n=1 Tax=Puccinia graminis f. sp. tritici TaxID=56615 RepID=A0A5B0RSV8_PUCGR|nr:hypothetical protein PGTUg99_019490 [Puccinia graminis f. sp. tritici]